VKTFLKKLYILFFMAITVFLAIVIWNLTFDHVRKEYMERKETLEIKKMMGMKKRPDEERNFQKDILETEERVEHYLGNKIVETQRLEDHFHHIGFDFKPDNQSYCVECHSDFPHDKAKEIRAFTNMHASFIACLTCHMKSGDDVKIEAYKWYDRANGNIVDSPVREETLPGTYDSKIIPFERVNGELRRVDTPERKNFAMEYRKNENTLTDIQKSKSKKMIHQIISEKAYTCEDCHQKESPILPFKDLGYRQTRIDAFLGTEVVGMIRNYTQFYIPRILHPGFEN